MKTKIVVVCAIALVLLIIGFWLYPQSTPISPLGTLFTKPTEKKETNPYIILGFAPYWNLKKIDSTALNSITHFAYFALHLESDGALTTHVNRREEEPGYTNYKRILKNNPSDKALVLTFMPINQEALTGILSSPTNSRRAIATVMAAVEESGASGVNIDFEPLGTSTPELRANFVSLIGDLQESLNSGVGKRTLSISIYPSAAARPRLWDLPKLEPFTDQFVVMTYDYTLPGDDKTGPNSPLRGAGTLFEHDILKNLSEITKYIPPQKILLGLPFYGYEWETPDTAKYTPVENRATVASLERIKELIDNNTLELLWDRNTLTPYGIRRENGEVISQIYFENDSSIKLKLDLVKQAGLGGIAIWALGYEGRNDDLWSTIVHTLNTP